MEREWLHLHLGATIQVEHVGSTAVSGMICKPIVDIAVSLPVEISLDWVEATVRSRRRYIQLVTPNRSLNRLYYVLVGHQQRSSYPELVENLDWEDVPPLEQRKAQIQIFPEGSPLFGSLVRMRDILRSSASARATYSAHKLDLARQPWPNSRAYALAKDKVIERILLDF